MQKNCKVELYSNSGTWLASAAIVDVKEEELFVDVKKYGKISKFPENSAFKLKVVDEALGLEYCTASLESQDGNNVHLVNVKTIEIVERRNDVKIAISHEGTVSDVSDPDVFYEVNYLNISASGIMFETHANLVETDVFEVVLNFLKTPLVLIVKVTRKKFDENEKIYTYACDFYKLDEVEEKSIREYVFKTQSVRAKKMKKS